MFQTHAGIPASFIDLPTWEAEVAAYLAQVYTAHIVERYYPRLLTKAGQEQTGRGFVLALHLAAADYTKGMPQIVFLGLRQRFEDFVRAVIDDEQVLRDALAALREVGVTS